MNEEEEIRQIRKELDELQLHAREQQRRIAALYRRLQELGLAHPQPEEKVPAGGGGFSLENFIGLRIIHLIGIVVLVIGLSIGVKYAIDEQLISEAGRIALAYAAGIALYLLSLRLKRNYAFFSAILFSGGMASLYFTTYGAFVYYGMLTFTTAFVIMIALTVFTVVQALLYSREEIAILGLVGAYGIPFLISRNTERPELLFLYIALINTAIVYLITRKPWRNTGRLAQLVTWVLFIGWAATRYDAARAGTGFFFMSYFFLLFAFNAVSGRLLRKEPLHILQINALVLNTLTLYIAALFVFGQSFRNAELALITLLVAVVAGVQYGLLYFGLQEKTAGRYLAAFSFVLFVVFMAFQWSGLTVTVLWLLTAILVFTAGVVRQWVGARMAAILLMGATLFKLVVFDSLTFSTEKKVISYLALGVLLLLVSYSYQRYRDRIFNNGKKDPAEQA